MTKSIQFETKYLKGFVSEEDLAAILPEVEKAHSLLVNKNGPGNDFLGWVNLPAAITETMLKEIEECAERMRQSSDFIVIVGIGGSYLGAMSTIEMLASDTDKEKIFFTGNNLCGYHLEKLLNIIEDGDKDISVNVISKSGTTTEPAVAFRIIENALKKKYGIDGLKDRVVCTTDKEKGALKQLADRAGYKTFVIPDDTGGRFSVLTPVGLLPAACAGINIRDIVNGAAKCAKEVSMCDLDKNQAYKYAAIRNILYRKGKVIEVLSSFDDKLHFIEEWWKQLFGESEGKSGRGIFPAACDFTTDLHSMGQLMQQGERNIFETFIVETNERLCCKVPFNDKNLDDLNYLEGKSLSYINKQAYLATCEAHFEGGVPNSTITISERSAFNLGQLFYFFETAVAISAYISGVNPFDQPGVEAYKTKMFKLLGKPDNK